MDRQEFNSALHDFARERRFQQGMRQTHDDLHQGMGDATRGAVRESTLLAVGTAVVGYAAAKNLRFRYWLQAMLHFPFAFLMASMVFLMSSLFGGQAVAGDEFLESEAAMYWIFASMGLAFLVSIIWSIVYIRRRTFPKLRAIEGR